VNESRVWLRRAVIRDFRNLESVDLRLPEGGLVVVGQNGQGKTNLLEAIYYLQIMRSARGVRDQELVRFGASGFHVALVATTDTEHELGVGFAVAGKKKRVTIDGIAAERMSDAFGQLPSVMFSPRDIQLVAGSPGERRRYLDLVLALSSRKYLLSLQQYRAALMQRNAALRDASRSGGSEDAIAAWEPQLADAGAVITCDRAAWVNERADEFTRISMAIGEAGEPRLSYHSSLAREANVRDSLMAALERQRKHDIRRGLTHAGPHRDDLHISVAGHDLRAFGSAGQQRTAAIALRMLEAATLRATSQLEPLLLLDDPFAELDLTRSEKILALLQSSWMGQTILAVPQASDIPAELLSLERVQIKNGAIIGEAK
jgi:DNA replication and repair protein RecF